MKYYELLSIIRPNLDMEEVEKVVNSLVDAIANFGGKVNNVDKLGRKKLAYEINNFKDGFYVILNIELSAEKIVDLKRYIKLNESFLREMVFQAEKPKAEVK